VTSLILQYSYLQILDLLTTTAFLLNGVHEANPLVKAMMGATPSPFGGLLLAKLLAVALGIYCWRVGKYSLLKRINVFFALVVVWNILVLIASSSGPTA
jgi:hypothetical protein